MEFIGRMPRWITPVVIGLNGAEPELEAWRCGRIVTSNGRLKYIQRRWIGYRASIWRVAWDKRYRPNSDRPECVLFYHHGLLSSDFLVLGYVYSHPLASLSSLYCACLVLDEIARIKGCHAIVTEVTNPRLTDRFLLRWGWERHCLHWSGRHFIKRFYGNYPDVPRVWRGRIHAD